VFCPDKDDDDEDGLDDDEVRANLPMKGVYILHQATL
jgi:hypothetical protein